MILTKFSLEINESEQFSNNPLVIAPIEFGELNLLVGKNASGKTTITDSIINIALMINSVDVIYGKWKLTWVDEETKAIYEYSYEANWDRSSGKLFNSTPFPITINGIYAETFSRDGKLLFERSNGIGRIYSNELLDYEEINPPADKHIFNIRRDEKRYPYLEKIARWAEGVHIFQFGHIHAPSIRPHPLDPHSLPRVKEKDFNRILGDIDEKIKHMVVMDFNQLGYHLECLIIKKRDGQNTLFVKEQGLEFELPYSGLSQGMFRPLSLLIFIHYLIEREHAQLIIIDDLCEGLDYDRAMRLGKILFNRMKEKGVQFIATSNDSFLMNVVDIEYWNVIHREGDVIKSRAKLEAFIPNCYLFGLSDFDLFSASFLD